jgi:hypothetical protein
MPGRWLRFQILMRQQQGLEIIIAESIICGEADALVAMLHL